jgi:hypothetical protein
LRNFGVITKLENDGLPSAKSNITRQHLNHGKSFKRAAFASLFVAYYDHAGEVQLAHSFDPQRGSISKRAEQKAFKLACFVVFGIRREILGTFLGNSVV